MKTLTILLIVLSSFATFSQVTRVEGRTSDDATEVTSKTLNEDLNISYVANDSTIQEFANYELADVLTVLEVTFFADKIFYRVQNSKGDIFGTTFTFADRTVFFADVYGNFVEVSGEGLSFAHQY